MAKNRIVYRTGLDIYNNEEHFNLLLLDFKEMAESMDLQFEFSYDNYNSTVIPTPALNTNFSEWKGYSTPRVYCRIIFGENVYWGIEIVKFDEGVAISEFLCDGTQDYTRVIPLNNSGESNYIGDFHYSLTTSESGNYLIQYNYAITEYGVLVGICNIIETVAAAPGATPLFKIFLSKRYNNREGIEGIPSLVIPLDYERNFEAEGVSTGILYLDAIRGRYFDSSSTLTPFPVNSGWGINSLIKLTNSEQDYFPYLYKKFFTSDRLFCYIRVYDLINHDYEYLIGGQFLCLKLK